MKKVMMVLLASLIAATGFSQSLTYMQGFDFNNGLNKPTQKLVADYFYTNAENNINVFSYNEWTIADNQGYGYMVLYGEYRIGNSNFWIHPETRFRVVGNGSKKAITDGVTGASEAYRTTDFQLIGE